jgi:ubiquinone/menaquinone biosynthesis C-methylase UbiE
MEKTTNIYEMNLELFSYWDDDIYSKVKKFLFKQMSQSDAGAILNILIGKGTDVEKVKKAKIVMNKKKKQNRGREGSRVDDILGIIPNGITVNNYLDVGCNEGKITTAMTKQFRLDRDHSFACDTIDQKITEDIFTFTLSTDSSLPYHDDTFDLVTLFMSAHHFLNPEQMIPEIRRVMKKSGVLVMRDHDVKTDGEKLFFDIVHCLYACVFNDEIIPEECNRKYATYRSSEELISMFSSFGFKCVRTVHKQDLFHSFYSVFVPI